jgi:hypothetical protein
MMPLTPQKRRPARAWRLLPLAALLGGCVSVPKIELPKLPDFPIPRMPTPAPAPGPVAAPAGMQQAGDLRALFAKGTVSGNDLLSELLLMKAQIKRDRSTAGLQQWLGSAGVAPAAGGSGGGFFNDLMQGKFDPTSVLNLGLKTAMSAFENELRKSVAGVAYEALDTYFDLLTDDPEALAKETVTLPSPQDMSPQQMQRAVTMAAMVVATRVTARMLKQAQADLASLDDEYKTLVARREKAATVLQEALAGAGSDQARSTLTDADLAYLRQLSLAEFSSDMGAQNLALRYLSAADPAAFGDYKAQEEGLSKRQQALMRTLLGTGAFGGLLVGYGKELAKLSQAKFGEIVAMGPLALAFATEAIPVFQYAAAAWSDGAGVLLKSTKTYRVTVDGKTVEVSDAEDVFKLMAQHGALPELQRSIFRDASRGLLLTVYNCDRGEAGRMLDVAVSQQRRTAFANTLRLEGAESFAFVNAFQAPPERRAEARLAEVLLASDQRRRTDQSSLAYADLQKSVADGSKPGFMAWNDDQLLRLIFASRESEPQYATLEVQGVKVRPVPSMRSLRAYEVLADTCRNQLLSPPSAAAPGLAGPKS